MIKRRWLLVGGVSALVLAAAGGWVAQSPPIWSQGRFAVAVQPLLKVLAKAMLDGVLPTREPELSVALEDWLQRLEVAVGALPLHAQAELSQLLTVLATAPGRRVLAGMATPWEQASVAEVQAALHGMRHSRLAVRQQAYLALHDLTGVAYFSDASTWSVLAYPGPTPL